MLDDGWLAGSREMGIRASALERFLAIWSGDE
jgi:hypothetical protein